MKISELRGLNAAELNKQLDDLYHEMFNLRFQRASGQLPDTNRLKVVRRSIAQVRTLLREQELGILPRGKAGA